MTVYKVLSGVKGSLQGMVKEICDGARICITTLGLKGHMGNGYQNPERLFVTMGEGHLIGAVAFNQGMQAAHWRGGGNQTQLEGRSQGRPGEDI